MCVCVYERERERECSQHSLISFLVSLLLPGSQLSVPTGSLLRDTYIEQEEEGFC